MRPREIIQLVTVGALALYVLYGVMTMPFPFFLLSVSVGLIVYGVTESVEMTAALTILTGAMSILISNYKRKEPFMNGSNPTEIVQRLKKVERVQEKAPVGVYATGYVEGFETIADSQGTNAATSGGPPPPPPAAAESKPAAANAPATTAQALPAAAAVTAAAKTNGFKDKAAPSQDGLFKLGVLPEEGKGGFHIDQGTTVLNALNALKPDEVKKMSEDTQKLIDTQKSLMMMLGTMKPMLSDGKQLIDTFNQMFGPPGTQTIPQMST